MARFRDNDDSADWENQPDEDELLKEFEALEGNDDIDISMEVDQEGRPVYYAEDSTGGLTTGESEDEARAALEERRRQYRDLLRRSREGDAADDDLEEAADKPAGPGPEGVDVSMEIDEQGNEVWYAQDSRIPGSTSMGHSVEEAVEGLEERREHFREMRRKSKEQRSRRRRKGQ